MGKVRLIMNRLIIARRQAGLTQSQAAKLLGLSSPSTLSHHESGARDTEPKLSMFLDMCEIYDVSPVWALTGVNPDFDEESFDELTQFADCAIEDIDNLKRLLSSLSSEGE